ncbi:DUF3536 domain-containing protein [Desulfovibrio sp. OttesenSCG-928-C06]|nr:DUF3536 domain-containing protein [Desulfovibrio sp. OttesenSCG-928-C06]
MSIKTCIHGHFYQPPREDPWLGRIFSEASAAPARHWNERITNESYGPLAWARRLDEQGHILDIVNCYEWISFNIGPTLALWMEREAPEVLERIREADRRSLERWGHGNAMAQVYHHVIMPLASELDKRIEIRWALDDFRARFGREAEGMWLSECAVDTDTLEVLAAEGVKFVTLSPHQARAVAEPSGRAGESAEVAQNVSGSAGKTDNAGSSASGAGSAEQQDNTADAHNAGNTGLPPGFWAVDAGSLDISRPYRVDLPSGKSIAVFFYHGSLAQSVAFEGLLADGERFWRRFAQSAAETAGDDGIMCMATDGETYGHHFKFGEMSLAYVLAQGMTARDNVELTNFAAYLAGHPAEHRVLLHEPSSWSCAHGIERWRDDCGCSTGGHDGWNQKWRKPLRNGLNRLKEVLDAHYFEAGKAVFNDPEAALLDFGKVLANPDTGKDFVRLHVRRGKEKIAWRLLHMQEGALASFASCAWFFDDISRIEPVKSMSFALRAMQLCTLTGGPDITAELEKMLEEARSNKPEEGSGKRIFEKRVLPSQQDYSSLCLFAYLDAYCSGSLPRRQHDAAGCSMSGEVTMSYPSIKVRLYDFELPGHGKVAGKAEVMHTEARTGEHCDWSGFLPFVADNPLESRALIGISSLTAVFGDGLSLSRGSHELARHLQDFLNIRLLASTTRDDAGKDALALAHCVSNLGRIEEAQETQNAEPLWMELLTYLPLACFFQVDTRITQKLGTVDVVDVAAGIMRRGNLTYNHKLRCMELLETVVLGTLKAKSMRDAELAAAVRRAARVLPDMNWWKVQNHLWSAGLVDTEYRETARAVHFGF